VQQISTEQTLQDHSTELPADAIGNNPLESTISFRPSLERVSDVLRAQERVSTSMAHHLESLGALYDAVAAALKESEAGTKFDQDDMAGMHYTSRLFYIRLSAFTSSDASRCRRTRGDHIGTRTWPCRHRGRLVSKSWHSYLSLT
jgi:hypothetical protein